MQERITKSEFDRDETRTNEDASMLVEFVENVAKKVLSSFKRNQPTTWNVKIVSPSSVSMNALANVYVDGDSSNTIQLKNKTGETLATNNECIAFAPTSNLANAVILYRK